MVFLQVFWFQKYFCLIVNVWDAVHWFDLRFQDTKVFGGTVPRGHGNDGLLTDLKRLLDEAEDLEEDFDEVIRRPSQRRPRPNVSSAVEYQN